MDYNKVFVTLKKIQKKKWCPLSRRTCKIICLPNNCGAKSEPPFWISHFLKSFDVFVCEHLSFQLLRCMEKTNKHTKTTKQNKNKINKNKTPNKTKHSKTKQNKNPFAVLEIDLLNRNEYSLFTN